MKNNLESGDEKLARQLSQFALNMNDFATIFEISEPELTGIKADADYFNWTVTNFKKVHAYKQSWTKYKNTLRKSSANETLDFPELPAFCPAPPAVAPDLLNRFTAMANRIKLHPSYNLTIGRQLGILNIGAAALQDETVQPLIKVIMRDSKVSLVWKKSGFTGIHVEKDSGNGFTTHDKVFSKIYIDNASIPQGKHATWKYRAIYLSGDDQIGLWSPVVSVNVAG
ncbi:hypothetical protein [Flavobacterium sp. 3HN19-14]|uniref:hypothetical protein n=1 Tax=Flavobacterium sp. 3HN19-14 TaxID=3448133 RepID=UPI003EE36B92